MSIPPSKPHLIVNLNDFVDLDSLDLLWKQSNIKKLQSGAVIKDVVNKTIEIIQDEFETKPEAINPHRTIILQSVNEKIKSVLFENKNQNKKALDKSTFDECFRLQSIVQEILSLTEKPDILQKKLFSISNPDEAYKIGMKYLDVQKRYRSNISVIYHWAIKFLNKAADLYIQNNNLQKAMEVRVLLSNLKLDSENVFSSFSKRISDYKSIKHPLLGECNFGVTLSGVDGQSIKRGTIQAREIKIDGKEQREFIFKVSNQKGEMIRKTIEKLSFDLSVKKFIQEQTKCGKISCTESDYLYLKRRANSNEFQTDLENKYSKMGRCLKINFENLGQLQIGIDSNFGSMYNRVVIHLDKNASFDKVQKLFALIGLADVSTRATDYDLHRYKLNALTHYFYPKVAASLESNPDYLNMPLDDLKRMLDKIDPEISKMHTRELPNIVWEEISPGEHLLRLKKSSESLRKLGAKGFMCGFNGSFQNTSKTIASVIQSGAFSSQVRFEQGLLLGGASSRKDHKRNSADSVFTRLISENAFDKSISLCPFSGLYQVVFSLDLAETMPYCYSTDTFGCRNLNDLEFKDSYKKRPSLKELAEDSQKNWKFKNEVMFKRRIDPKYIKAITYNDPRSKIVTILEQENVVFKNAKTPEDKKKYISEHPDFVLKVIKDLQVKKMKENITSLPDHLEVQLIISELTKINFFPQEINNQKLKKEYLMQNLEEVQVLSVIESILGDNYKGQSVLGYWCQDPKEILIQELKKLGYDSNVNGIAFDEFIIEKKVFDEEMFKRC